MGGRSKEYSKRDISGPKQMVGRNNYWFEFAELGYGRFSTPKLQRQCRLNEDLGSIFLMLRMEHRRCLQVRGRYLVVGAHDSGNQAN